MSHQSERYIPYGRQWIDESDVEAVAKVLQSDFLTTGPEAAKLESAITKFCGAKFSSVVNSGTSALHAAYSGAGLGVGDEIITSPLTFAATANAALYLGATVAFTDIDQGTGCVDPNLIEGAINSRTRLLCPIDYCGQPADYDPINETAKAHGLKVIADAAHSFGATYHGRNVGTLADATEISMHPVKLFTTGEGGAVITNDPEIAAIVARFRTHGITRDRSIMASSDEGDWFYEMHELGFNYRMTDIQCALGISQMARLGSFLKRRREIAASYFEAFSSVKELILPTVKDGVDPAWHLFPIRVAGDPRRRRPFFEKLRFFGLGVQVHYVPVYLHPYYRDLGYEPGLCPNAEDYYNRVVSIPIFPRMSDDDVNYVVEHVMAAVKHVL